MQVINVHVKNLRNMNYNSLADWLQDPKHIYIGRANKYLNINASKWANPFSVEKYGREKALEMYENYIRESDLLKEIKELKGCILGCWCAPKKCHGDILIKLMNE